MLMRLGQICSFASSTGIARFDKNSVDSLTMGIKSVHIADKLDRPLTWLPGPLMSIPASPIPNVMGRNKAFLHCRQESRPGFVGTFNRWYNHVMRIFEFELYPISCQHHDEDADCWSTVPTILHTVEN